MSTEAVRDGRAPDPTGPVDVDDPREAVAVGVLMADGRLAPRTFATRAQAEAWARPDEGDRVVEFNVLCECGFTS
ncbi:hypothetical protein DDP54_05835 [Cellulomonas sp. WB94]|uniref:hypothetical protein n=1 Tax=Cellulomonas sp. WB94 TaxID=2173174 RepID=UPI000D568A9C|nr:hypothetical protein [Cellulomonas sp. WB94]PVU82599.1 hypothetical protein DDP54_05835 [Cellulomonas sp. WB94]